MLSLFAYEALTLYRVASHPLQLNYCIPYAVRTPKVLLPSVWPLPRSLATTKGISVDVSSSPYLDVSVQAVPSVWLCIHHTVTGLDSSRVSPFGYPRIIACFRLPVAFRRSLRPSSAPSAKASPLRSCSLDHYEAFASFSPIMLESLLGSHRLPIVKTNDALDICIFESFLLTLHFAFLFLYSVFKVPASRLVSLAGG